MSIEDLIEGCLRQEKHCQEELFRRYAGKMLSVCKRYCRHRLEAEDILQDGFIKAFSKLDQFKFSGSFEYWLRRIMINTALKNYKRSFYKKELLSGDAMPYDRGIDPDAYDNLGVQDLLEMIAELPDGYRAVFNMYAIEGYSHKEIGEILQIQESTSRSQLVKARKILQDKINKRIKSVA
ncbi:MAG: sigma-70 family RNA polymerase sigma factor [Saprospiraceae bacterium]|nr:sigma-70 family RNA polymerase sigma factor [Saprospiraceae bacterium]